MNQPPHAPPHAPTPKRTDTPTPDPRTRTWPRPNPQHTQPHANTLHDPPPARQRQPHAAVWPAPAPCGSRRGPPGPPPQCPDQASPERRNNTHRGVPIRGPTRNGAHPRRTVSEGLGSRQRQHTLPISGVGVCYKDNAEMAGIPPGQRTSTPTHARQESVVFHGRRVLSPTAGECCHPRRTRPSTVPSYSMVETHCTRTGMGVCLGCCCEVHHDKGRCLACCDWSRFGDG